VKKPRLPPGPLSDPPLCGKDETPWLIARPALTHGSKRPWRQSPASDSDARCPMRLLRRTRWRPGAIQRGRDVASRRAASRRNSAGNALIELKAWSVSAPGFPMQLYSREYSWYVMRATALFARAPCSRAAPLACPASAACRACASAPHRVGAPFLPRCRTLRLSPFLEP
jgi:hypothetical protein